ncbi:MAG TPA: glucosaminidase domain-containing protein [Acidimicrobiia bacterium]|nr:glucosaminidase domain-containing protein [Acidimicrobiia bacterium]
MLPRPTPSFSRLSKGVVALAVTVVSLVGAIPAHAQQSDPTPTDPAPTSAGPTSTTTTRPADAPDRADAEAYRDLATQLSRNQRDQVDVAAQLEQANVRLTQLTDELTTVQTRLDETRAALAALRQTVKSRAAFMYTNASAPQTAIVDIEHVQDISAGKQYAESATRRDIGKIGELTALADSLDGRRRELTDAKAAQEADRDRLQKAKDDLDALIAKQQRLLDQAGAITVMGEPELTAAQMSEWFASRGARYRLMGGMTITELAQIYVEEGALEHVRPELAFVQAILETGSFGNATDNNFAGIGACDSCVGQIPFATPRDGVRGQIQMLRNYADPLSRAANLANPPSAPIYGSDPVRAAAAYDTFFAKGRVPTWNLMGDGNWATDPGYAPKVLTLYFQLVSFATRRAA